MAQTTQPSQPNKGPDPIGNDVPLRLTPDMPNVRDIVLQPGIDTETGIPGWGYSPDNGTHFYVINTIWGRKYRKEDAKRLWKFLKPWIEDVIEKAISEYKEEEEKSEGKGDKEGLDDKDEATH